MSTVEQLALPYRPRLSHSHWDRDGLFDSGDIIQQLRLVQVAAPRIGFAATRSLPFAVPKVFGVKVRGRNAFTQPGPDEVYPTRNGLCNRS
jgi:hypothetical protein